jgi:hypothetical protein
MADAHNDWMRKSKIAKQIESNSMNAPEVKRTERPNLTRKEKPKTKADTTSVAQAELDNQPSRQPNFLPTSRWGIEELEAVLADSVAGVAIAKPAVSAPAVVRVVRFEFLASDAHEVFLVGSFNKWSPRATPLTRTGKVRWVKELSLPPGRYEYRFLVDGQWKEDPKIGDYMPNPVGGFNSVRQVE